MSSQEILWNEGKKSFENFQKDWIKFKKEWLK